MGFFYLNSAHKIRNYEALNNYYFEWNNAYCFYEEFWWVHTIMQMWILEISHILHAHLLVDILQDANVLQNLLHKVASLLVFFIQEVHIYLFKYLLFGSLANYRQIRWNFLSHWFLSTCHKVHLANHSLSQITGKLNCRPYWNI